MKKTITAIVVMLSVITAVYAASPLVEEYKRRAKILFSDNDKAIFEFLETLGKSPAQITELETFGTTGKFVMKYKGTDVCFGDYKTASLECYNSIGYRTYFEAGDSD